MDLRLLGVTDPALKELNRKIGGYEHIDKFDPAQNIEAGICYLRLRIYRAHGNLPRALAGYGAGPRYAQDVTQAENALDSNPTDAMRTLTSILGR